MKLNKKEVEMLYKLVAGATDQYYCDLMEEPDYRIIHGPDDKVKEKLKNHPCDKKKYEVLESLYYKLREAAHVESDKLWD